MEQDVPSIPSLPPLPPNPNTSSSFPSSYPLPQPLLHCSAQVQAQSSVVFPPTASEHFKTLHKNANNVPRIRAYHERSPGPWMVFFRPKGKPLNVIQISRDLTKRFSAVTEISKVKPNKLRVSVSSLKQANEIVASELFTREYHVYVPSREVEIDGVVTEASLTCEDLLQFGIGRFKNP